MESFGLSIQISMGLSHLENALHGMVVTESPIVTLVRLVQFSNALNPMVVTESGIAMLVRLVQL